MRAPHRDDEGFALILVIGFMLVISIVISVALAVADRSITSTRSHQAFDQALAISEDGIDQTLARVQQTQTYSVGPATGVTEFASADAERAWARSTIVNLATTTPSLLQTVGTGVNGGQYLAIRPADRQTVYAMSFVPSFASAQRKSRLVKSEYLFSPYKPTDAILTSGSVDLSGSVAVSTLGTPAPVHSNSSVTTRTSDQICGPITAVGTYDNNAKIQAPAGTTAPPGGCDPNAQTGGGALPESVPLVDPRYTFNTTSAQYVSFTGTPGPLTYTGSWFDLCPDGTVQVPGTVPCNASNVVLDSSGTWHGWTFSPATATTVPTWTMGLDNSPYAGAWYVYGANAVINGNTANKGTPWNATIIAEPVSSLPTTIAATCNKVGGDITWNHSDLLNYLPGLIIEAGADLFDGANNNAGDGLIAAGDQVHLQTSSATLTGAVLASDRCKGDPSSPDTNQVQGIAITFDSTAQAPTSSIVNTTLWLEYVG